MVSLAVLTAGATAACSAEKNALGVSCDIPAYELDTLAAFPVLPPSVDLCDDQQRGDLVADVVFLNAVHAVDLPLADDTAMKIGSGTCELVERAIDSGQSLDAAVTFVVNMMDMAGEYTERQNRALVSAGTASYCPEYSSSPVRRSGDLPAPRATATAQSDDQLLQKAVTALREQGESVESADWVRQVAGDVCDAWEEGATQGYTGSALVLSAQLELVRSYRFNDSLMALIPLTQYGCPDYMANLPFGG